MPYARELVFGFFANPQNLPPLMPKWQQAQVEEVIYKAPPPTPVGSPAKIAAGVGTTMILSFRMVPYLPPRMRWHALITEFEWNDHFCDVQTAGPFFFWKHCHSLRDETRDGVEGTVVRDEVTYEFPLGPLGDVANALGGRAQITSLFGYRQRQTAALMAVYAERVRSRRG